MNPSVLMLLMMLTQLLLHSAAAGSEVLTIERIFASPDLAGAALRGLQVSPAGDRVTYLRGKEEDRETFDLWEYHIADRQFRLLVDSRELVPDEGELSAEEKARRERARLAGQRGIVEYRWSADGRHLLFPLGGDIYLYAPTAPSGKRLTRVTSTPAFETDPEISPDGTKVAFIREQDLYVVDLASGHEIRLTHDGGGAIKNGMAEFIAQEEMGRDTGYWWSPDSRRVAFLRVDESAVPLTRRFEIEAGDITITEQRYPYAGGANAHLTLGVVDAGGGAIRWLDPGLEPDGYLPRLAWLPDSATLSVQTETRDQRRLDLLFFDVDSGRRRPVLSETMSTWVTLHDDLHFLEKQAAFIWSSERSGFRHLYLYSLDGELIRPLTAGPWAVDEVHGIEEANGYVYFTATEATPVESHLYRQSLHPDDAERPTRLTHRKGSHDITMAKSGQVYLDFFSSRDRPPQVSLHRAADGERLAWLNENRLDAAHPYAPYLAAHRPTEYGTLAAEDGQTLYYRLTKPANFSADNRYPVFLYVYGGPTGQTVVNRWDRRLLFEQYMAQHGFVVFSLDNRGTPRRGVAFQAPVDRRLGTVEVRDQRRGVEFLKKSPFVDPQRIGVFGWSYGGYMTLMMLMQDPGVYALGAAVAPVTDWALYDTHYTERYLGTPAAEPAAYRNGNVLTYASQLSNPLLLIHGMADDNVLFTNSTNLMAALQNAGILFNLMTYPGAKHGISGEKTQVHVFQTIADFFIGRLAPLSHEQMD